LSENLRNVAPLEKPLDTSELSLNRRGSAAYIGNET